MTEADIKIAAYHECIHICRAVEATTGSLTGTGARMVRSKLEDLIEEVLDREHHRQVVEVM